jgi:hypothetical protein
MKQKILSKVRTPFGCMLRRPWGDKSASRTTKGSVLPYTNMQEESIHEPSSDEKRKKKKVCL